MVQRIFILFFCLSNNVLLSQAQTEVKANNPIFDIVERNIDFGMIDLGNLDSSKIHYELLGEFKLINHSSKPVTIFGQASAHTMCTELKYTIPANGEILVHFKSLVERHHSAINRTIASKPGNRICTSGTV